MNTKKKNIISVTGIFAFVLITVFLIYYIHINNLWDIILNQEKLKKYLEITYGNKLYLSFIILQIIQVVIFFIPGEAIQISGGYIFGKYFGILYNFIGIFFGSLLVFLISRYFARPLITNMFNEKKIIKFNNIINSKRGKLIILSLFIFPGFPKDSLCYLLGLTNINFILYLLISNIGRLPAMIVTVFLGDSIAKKNWYLVISVSISVLIIIGSLYILKNKNKKIKNFFNKIN